METHPQHRETVASLQKHILTLPSFHIFQLQKNPAFLSKLIFLFKNDIVRLL